MLTVFILLILLGIVFPAVWATYILYKLYKLEVGKWNINKTK